jgi:hypothetical protein
MIKTSIFDRIKAPWFEPEFDLGTDVQICQKAREAGFSVWWYIWLDNLFLITKRS